MSKNKNDKHTTFDFEPLAAKIGLTAMSVAALAGILEAHEGRISKLIMPMQPAYAQVSEPVEPVDRGEVLMHREKEEIRHATVSYGVTMRSHPVTGKA
jgi:hypothetical protein